MARQFASDICWNVRPPKRQSGSVIVTVCLMLMFLLGFMGIALDFGHLFVVKTEMQTAMDSCALAAAQELDKQPLSIVRARNAGRTAGNLNKLNFQKDGYEIIDENITFRDEDYIDTVDPEAARYVTCSFERDDIRMWLLHIAGVYTGNSNVAKRTRSVIATAVATLTSGSACPIPVGLVPKPGGTHENNYNYAIGEWVPILDHNNPDNMYPDPGEMGWFNINGSQSAKDTKKQLSEGGVCETEIDDSVELSTNGAKQGVAPEWNGRFGLYKGQTGPADIAPDLSGHSYNSTNWPDGRNAWPDFVAKRVINAPNGGAKGGGWKTATAAQHKQYGYNRRLVTVPVLSAASKIIDFACMFMAQPMTEPPSIVHLEFRGLASVEGSPCTTNGLAGALAGPKVPVLVR